MNCFSFKIIYLVFFFPFLSDYLASHKLTYPQFGKPAWTFSKSSVYFKSTRYQTGDVDVNTCSPVLNYLVKWISVHQRMWSKVRDVKGSKLTFPQWCPFSIRIHHFEMQRRTWQTFGFILCVKHWRCWKEVPNQSVIIVYALLSFSQTAWLTDWLSLFVFVAYTFSFSFAQLNSLKDVSIRLAERFFRVWEQNSEG